MTASQTPTTATTSSSTGLASNVAGALAYLLGPISGIAFLVLEKEDRFVRYHAMHSVVIGVFLVVLSIAVTILSGVLAFVPVLGWLVAFALSLVLGFGSLALWLFLMYSAWSGREWEAPIAGPLARKYMQ